MLLVCKGLYSHFKHSDFFFKVSNVIINQHDTVEKTTVKTAHLKYGWLGDMVICSTSLVMSSSEKASFKLSDCKITYKRARDTSVVTELCFLFF